MARFSVDRTFDTTARTTVRFRWPVLAPGLMVVVLMALEALTLAVFATLHLTGTLRIDASNPSYGAGVAEGLICIALAAGAWSLWRSPARGRRAALAAVFFAIAGFIVGLTFTIDGGDSIDLIYHATMLAVLVATAALLARRPPRPVQDAQKST